MSTPSLLTTFLSMSLAVAPPAPLTPARKAEVFKQVAASKEFTALVGGDKKVVAASSWVYREKAAAGATETEFAEILHFDYNSGRTIRTRFDLTSSKVVRAESLEAYPTPLADEELAKAKEIAQDKSEAVQAFLRAHGGDQVAIAHLAPVVADRKNPLFGSRLVDLIYTASPNDPVAPPLESITVRVNLSTETLIRD